jgi:hypothetical protein
MVKLFVNKNYTFLNKQHTGDSEISLEQKTVIGDDEKKS